MSGPVLNVNSVNQIDASAFVEKDTNTLQNGKIRLGNSFFSVKVDNSKINAGYFNNLNMSKETKSHLQDKLTADKIVISEKFNIAKEIGNNEKIKQVILHGMSDVKQPAKIASDEVVNVKKAFKPTTIDTYNSSIGIEKENVSKDPINTFNSIRNGTIDKGLSADDVIGHKEDITLDIRAEWKQYLKDNADKVDIFKKVASFINEGSQPSSHGAKTTGWAEQVRKYGIDDTLKGFILKQMEPSDRKNCLINGTIDKYISVLKECAIKSKEGALNKQEYEAVLDKHFPNRHVMENKNKHHNEYSEAKGFGNIIANAFFRQTGKLGVQFFESKGIKVIFQWSDHNGLTADKKENKASLNNKWWLDNGFNDVKNVQKYVAITFSEMPQVEQTKLH